MISGSKHVISLLAATGLAAIGPAHASTIYDLVIVNGRVMDPESGRDEVANVAISAGKIVAIGREQMTGRRTINARDHVVSPGFIDMHIHTRDETSLSYEVRDGVTTALELELGAFPLQSYYDQVSKNAFMNYGASVGYGAIRLSLQTGKDPANFGLGAITSRQLRNETGQIAKQPISEADQDRADKLVKTGFAQGGIGIGLGIEYIQGADQAEIYRLFKTAGAYKALVFTHTREFVSGTRGNMLGAMLEVLADAAITGAPLHICHVSSKGLDDTPIILDAIRSAKRRGIDVSVEVPSYAMATGGIGSALFDPGWRERWNSDYSALELPSTGERLTESSFNELRKDHPETQVMKHITPESAVDVAMADPDVIIASDSVEIEPGKAGNPRASGTFSRTLGRYVRERKLLPLMDALRRMTLLPAKRLEKIAPAMATKGRLQVGADADVTIFNPATVIDRGTALEPAVAPVGIPYVIVNGRLVVDKGAIVSGTRPGKAIRGVLGSAS